MRTDFDYIVVGLGGIGSAAAYWLARRAGADVLGLEQFEIGHGRGASQDHSRIIRRSYHSPTYVALSADAYRTWSALEADCGEELIVRTGGLDIWPPDATISLADYSTSMRSLDVPFEVLDAAETMKRWPQFHLQDDTTALYQPDAGIAPAARCNAMHVRMARRYGATLEDRCPVTSIRRTGDAVEVDAGGHVYRCHKLALCTDAWANELLADLGLRLPLTVTQEQVTYWVPRRLEDFSPERFPVWIWMDEPSFYGFPVFGEAAVKAGQDVGGRRVSARTRTFDVDRAALERVRTWLERHLPDAAGSILLTKSCLYAMPPDRDFVIDHAGDHVVIALGAAHGFKFASLLGRILAELAIDGATSYDISAFGIDRAALGAREPASGPVT
jgi:sarcosine oxidase